MSTRDALMLDTVREIHTPEGVALRLPAAGPVPRAFAWLIDLAIRFGLLLLASTVFALLGRAGSGLYLVLLFAVELHGGVGLYRLAVKWGWFEGDDPNRTRTMLKRLKWGITVFFLVLGLTTLAAYMKIGHEHRDRVGERYVPSYMAPAQQR